MSLKKGNVAHRAWNLVRFSLLWARKGGMFRRRVVMDQLRLVPKYLKRLGHTAPPSQINYFERELSFDKTPIFNVKMHRPSSMRFSLPHIPCINPHVDFDYDFNDNGDAIEYDNGRKSALIIHNEEYYHGYEGCQEIASDEEEHEEGIDERAEEFIAQFYQQMKLQRQISYLQYNETPIKDSN
ncbi:hypothetical protein TanjilG_15433 [Lupinus angustifolius]|uniref:Cotton fiber protein n=1 Tax=Lupinus angustifolius TaxID=3871 RepID=A0A4P1RLT2_LUPAN|nr:PREDICTED: uncharacterized protein LOC109346288 [Lupinus angustifolius]OIW12984.1 hypothetical protein TanjilG_15433 [Lupinus angustifolius]